MNSLEFDSQFTSYRAFLRDEIHRYHDSVSVYRQLHEQRAKHLDQLNLAPAFFSVVDQSLVTTIILWGDKLLDEGAERGIFHFLRFIENNRKWLSVDELKRRRSYHDDHWFIQNREPVDFKKIEADRMKLRSVPSLYAFRLHRDKLHGHFDKKYAFDKIRLHQDAPIKWEDLTGLGRIMGEVVNDYSIEFNGEEFSWDTINIQDLDTLLTAAQRGKRRK